MGIGAQTKPTRKKKQPLPEPKERLRPVSLYPLDFDAAMKGLLASGSSSRPNVDDAADDTDHLQQCLQQIE